MAGGGGCAVWAAAAPLGADMAASQQALIERKRQLQRERAELAKETKAAERKRMKLMEKARGLTDEDLMSIIGQRAMSRAAAAAKAAAKPKAKPKAKGNAKAKAKAKANPDAAVAGVPADE